MMRGEASYIARRSPFLSLLSSLQLPGTGRHGTDGAGRNPYGATHPGTRGTPGRDHPGL